MINLKILIIKLSPVEGLNSSMIRTLALTKGLLSLGHTIDFVTIPISNTHVKTDMYDFMDNVKLISTTKNVLYEGITSKESNTSTVKTNLIKILRKIYHKFSLYNYTHSIAKDVDISILNDKYYDIVISSSDPKTSHIAMKRLINQGLKYKKWIQYWGDPMTLDITKKTVYPKFFIRNIEYNILKDADKIIYVSPITLKKQKVLFPNLSNKMHSFPVPYIQKRVYPEPENKLFTIGYYGAYPSNVRDILPLYKSCVQLVNKVHLDIIGDTDLSLETTQNVKIYPRGDISTFEEKADLLVCMLNSRGTQIPGKLYHYAATNKPILVLLDGENKEEIKKYLESFDRYIICENNIQSVTSALNDIVNSSKAYSPCSSFAPEIIANSLLRV